MECGGLCDGPRETVEQKSATAAQAGDDATTEVLAELERVLIEIANTPQDATKDDLEALRARIASRGLLFKVRVVHSEMRQRERQPSLPGSTS